MTEDRGNIFGSGVAVGSTDRRRAGIVGRMVGVAVLVIGLLTGCTSAADGPAAGSADAAELGTVAPSAAVDPSPPSSGLSPAATSLAATSPGSTTSSEAGAPEAPTAFTETVVPLAPGTSDEASGIAASSTLPGAYFLVDDGTGTDQLVAVDSGGLVIARIGVDGMSARNAEALAAGSCGTTPLPVPDSSANPTCLYIGDIGDNAARRDSITIYRIAEPDLTMPPTEPVPADEWTYSYPDEPQNAESLMVDGNGSLLIVTKPSDGQPHHIYRAEPGGGVLSFVREFRPPAPQIPMKTLFTGNVVTDATSAPGRVLLLTYDEVQQFTAPDPAADIANFPDWPRTRLRLPALPQAEGITAAADGCGYTVASEAGPGGKAGALGIVRCR
jgi:hypothetical protein